MRIRLLAVAVAALLIAGVGDLVMSTSARAATTTVYTEHLTNEQWVFGNGTTAPLPTGPPAPGDRYFLRFDLSQNGTLVGFVNVACTEIFNGNSECIGVLAVDGKGDFTVTGLIRPNGQAPPVVFDLAITGGTFGFSGVHGYAHVENSGPGDQTLTLHLQ